MSLRLIRKYLESILRFFLRPNPEFLLGFLIGVMFLLMSALWTSSYFQDTPDEQECASENKSAGKKTTECKTFWQRTTYDPASFFTLCLVVIGGTQAAFFIWQLRLLRNSLVDTKKSADAARETADTAKLAMITESRAYIHFFQVRYISHLSNEGAGYYWNLRPQWVNHGDTPTRRLRISINFRLEDDILPEDFKFDNHPMVAHVIPIAPKGSVESSGYVIWAKDLDAVANGKKHLCVWGTCIYNDVFPNTTSHITKFCVKAISVTGDPFRGWDVKDNPLEIIFAHHHAHNCADEECEASGFQ